MYIYNNMCENRVCGSLILRTFDIISDNVNAVNVDNEYGEITINGNNVTWKNVDIRACIGSYLYNKHKRFNLKMTSAQVRHNGLAATSDMQLLVYISGLPFTSESCYNTRNNATNQSCLGAVNFICPTISSGTTSPITAGLVTFEKPTNQFVNINIEFKNSSYRADTSLLQDKPLVGNGTAYIQQGHWSLVMDIYGVDDD